MKKRLLYILILPAILLAVSCSKRIVPATRKNNEITAYDSTKFDYVFTEALRQKFLGNAGDALKYLEQCIKLNPKSDAAYYEMSEIYLMLSDNSRGKNYALKALSLCNKNVWYLTLVANIYYQEKNLDSTIYYYEKATALFPEKEDIKMNLAKIYSENKEYKKAAEVYNYLEEKYGVNESTSLSLIKNLISSGDFKTAELKVKSLIDKNKDNVLYNGLLAEIYNKEGRKDKAAEIYTVLINNNPGNAQVQLTLCDFMINEKEYESLFPLLNKISINDSISREDKITLFSKIISDSSLVNSYGNNIEIALFVLEAENKDDGIIVLLRPDLYVNEKKTANAIKRLEEIISAQQENYFAWEKLLILYSETKDWNKLFTKGEECATHFNRAYLPKILYANAAMEKEKYDIAEEELRKAKILAGSDTEKIVQVLVMDADVYYRKKEFIKSFETFKEAMNLAPDDIIIMNNYAYYLAEQGQQLKDAEKMAKRVIEKEKGNPTYLDTYAWVLYKRGRYKEAEKIMESLVKEDNKEDAEYYEHLGYIEKALKKCDKAIENWKIALEIDNRKSTLIKEIENCGKH